MGLRLLKRFKRDLKKKKRESKKDLEGKRKYLMRRKSMLLVKWRRKSELEEEVVHGIKVQDKAIVGVIVVTVVVAVLHQSKVLLVVIVIDHSNANDVKKLSTPF